jgi:hypothetical protein
MGCNCSVIPDKDQQTIARCKTTIHKHAVKIAGRYRMVWSCKPCEVLLARIVTTIPIPMSVGG